MGARLSQPRGSAGTTESSVPSKSAPPPTPKNPWPRRINSRTIASPAAAFTMAILLFVYARTSIRAAKANAQRYRDADTGGEGLSLLAEHRRRHGMAKRVEGDEGGTVRQIGQELLGGSRRSGEKAVEGTYGRSEEEEQLRSLTGKGKRRGGSGDAA